MSRKAAHRVERLLDYREKERDRAGTEVGIAAAKRDRVAEEARRATLEAERELFDARRAMDGIADPLDLDLAVGCVASAEGEAARTSLEEITAEGELARTRERLVELHKRARQLELLLNMVNMRLARGERAVEQRETDDLVAVKKVCR